jgi:hypothetical protein
MFVIPTADDLVTFIKDFTGSTNDEEIKKCIFMAELSMRNIELPALRCNPYLPENIGVADANGRIPIPGDMNKPILFFKQGGTYNTSAPGTGVSGQNTIQLTGVSNLPLSSGMVVSGTGVAPGATIQNITGNSGSQILTLTLNNTGTVSGTINFTSTANRSSQTGPWIVYDRIGDRDIITQSMIAQLYLQPVNVPAVIRGKFSEVGQVYEFLPYIAEGDLINMYYYKAWPLLFSPIGSTGQTVQNNAVLSTWAEGYVYATLREYYIKRHNDQDAAVYDAKYKEAWNIVEDQNNLGKWSGGHTRLTSVWQPRQYRQYNIK